MKKYQYLASWDDQTLTRVGEPVVVLGDSNVSQVEVILPSNFLLDPTGAVARMYFLLPGEKESGFETLETATKDENGDSHVTWTIKHVHSQKGGRLAFSLTLIGDDAQWDSRTAIIPVYESRYQPESEEAEEPYTGRLTALEGSMASIRGEFTEVQEDFEELKETATLGTPIPESLVANMQEGRVYIYTGTESGYTAGHVYYYVGGALTDGGQYGGTTVDATLTVSGAAADAKVTGDKIAEIKEDLSTHEVRITELEDGGSGGLSKTAVNLLNTILSEAVYGSDQSKNIILLYKELSNVKPISITAVLTGRALAGMRYSELTFDITATYDDESTVTVSEGYRVITSGTVHNGSNTVTVRYRGATTDVTFMAEQVVTHTITYNLTDVSSSNVASVVVDGAYYSTTLSVKADYGFNGCTVTMGGVDITETAFGNMEILIAEVTGDVVITASATEYTYLNDLLPTSEIGFTIVQGYRNGTIEDTPMFKQAYDYIPFVSEYPALNDCTIHWSIKNISDSDAPLAGCYFGNINPDNISGGISSITAFYCVGAHNSSNSLAPGAGLEGDVTVKGGMQLCFICKNTDFSKFEIKLRGNYVPNTFDGYGEVNPTNSNTSAYGGYRKVTYYRDDGSEVLASFNGTPRKIAVTLEPGIYDMYCSVQATTITANVRSTSVLIGGMSADTDTTVYYTGHGQGSLNAALWHHSTFNLSDSNMAIISGGNISAMNNTNTTLRIMYKKVVNA